MIIYIHWVLSVKAWKLFNYCQVVNYNMQLLYCLYRQHACMSHMMSVCQNNNYYCVLALIICGEYPWYWSQMCLPLHLLSLGSGSQNPFPMQLALLGPVSNVPLGHVNEALTPTRAGLLSRSTLKLLSMFRKWRGWTHLAAIITDHDISYS